MAKDDNGDGGLTTEEDCCQHSPEPSGGRGVVISELSQKKYREATDHKNLRSGRIDYIYLGISRVVRFGAHPEFAEVKALDEGRAALQLT